MGKASRKKGVERKPYRFICESHEPPFKGYVRFKHEDARKDWEAHNLSAHEGKNTDMTEEEAVALLLTQRIDGAPTGELESW